MLLPRGRFMAELTVYSTIGVRSAAEDLFSQFERANGHKIAVTWGHGADAGQARRERRKGRCTDLEPGRARKSEQARQDCRRIGHGIGKLRRRYRRESRCAEAGHLNA